MSQKISTSTAYLAFDKHCQQNCVSNIHFESVHKGTQIYLASVLAAWSHLVEIKFDPFATTKKAKARTKHGCTCVKKKAGVGLGA